MGGKEQHTRLEYMTLTWQFFEDSLWDSHLPKYTPHLKANLVYTAANHSGNRKGMAVHCASWTNRGKKSLNMSMVANDRVVVT